MPRHWERIEKITASQFDVENENFQLRNIMEAPLLENKEDIEVCNGKTDKRNRETVNLTVQPMIIGNVKPRI